MITYSIHYGAYLNQLCYPVKFLGNPPAKLSQKPSQLSALYLIIKKANVEIREFMVVLEKIIKIFKI